MSTGNGAAAIGLANTNKQPAIGQYVQDTTLPGPSADGNYMGAQSASYWASNWLAEDPGFTVPSNNGAAAGKLAQWVTSGAAAVTVPADGRMTVTAGTAVAASGTGLYKSFMFPTTFIPAGSFFWVHEV